MKCVCFLQRTAIRTLSKISSAGKSKSSGMPVLLRDTSSTLSRERNAQENIEKVERHNSLIWDCGFFYIQKSEGVRSMAVFRIERTRDYTVMSNHHLRNANLSLKAKGLLSMMLSLPEDWNYTTRGLASCPTADTPLWTLNTKRNSPSLPLKSLFWKRLSRAMRSTKRTLIVLSL